MWYVIEYKKTAKARKWIFQSMTGCKELAEQIFAEYEAAGIFVRLTTTDGK